jgi:hypothetical protein
MLDVINLLTGERLNGIYISVDNASSDAEVYQDIDQLFQYHSHQTLIAIMRLATIVNLLLATGAALAAPNLATRDPSSGGALLLRAGNDYPYKNSCNTAHDVDPWGFFKCECTSFVAWRINDVKNIKFTNWYKGSVLKVTDTTKSLSPFRRPHYPLSGRA